LSDDEAKEIVMADEQGRIVRNPAILAGKPVIRGTRISVEFVLELLAGGWSEADIIENYPGITREDIQACLSYALALVSSERSISAA
jgi:uncharacterized protein (DUF433 family)